jgi:hypothetical protein
MQSLSSKLLEPAFRNRQDTYMYMYIAGGHDNAYVTSNHVCNIFVSDHEISLHQI